MMTAKNNLEQTQDYWGSLLQDQTYKELPENLRNMMLCTPITTSNRTTFSILNLKSFHPEFASENILDVMGYTQETYLAEGLKLFIENLDDKHKSFPFHISQWIQDHYKNIPYEDKVNVRFSYCGLRFNHAKKKWIRLLIQQFFLEVDEDRNPLRACTIKSDISHLMGQDSLWLRISYGISSQHVKILEFDGKGMYKGDIISKRELDILLLLAEGLDIVEIGKKLFISPNTVKNHRQNMITHLGAKDTTALIQICRLCGIL